MSADAFGFDKEKWEKMVGHRVLGEAQVVELIAKAFHSGRLRGASDERARFKKTWEDFSWSSVKCVHGGTVCGTCLEQFIDLMRKYKRGVTPE